MSGLANLPRSRPPLVRLNVRISDPKSLGQAARHLILSMQTPLRQVLVHDRGEVIVVMSLDEGARVRER